MTELMFTQDHIQAYRANWEPFQGENKDQLHAIFLKALELFKAGRASVSEGSDADGEEEI